MFLIFGFQKVLKTGHLFTRVVCSHSIIIMFNIVSSLMFPFDFRNCLTRLGHVYVNMWTHEISLEKADKFWEKSWIQDICSIFILLFWFISIFIQATKSSSLLMQIIFIPVNMKPGSSKWFVVKVQINMTKITSGPFVGGKKANLLACEIIELWLSTVFYFSKEEISFQNSKFLTPLNSAFRRIKGKGHSWIFSWFCWRNVASKT